ncbi:MAG: acylphosphatase [Mucilaginibacter polytrichastri]|nr:acylphosphatase [Mucilaginibacter polytrichastri]
MIHKNISVSGKVQGVFFRAATKAVADQLGIRGYVKNKDDGSVFIEAEGDRFSMEQFLEWCAEGPEKARVDGVQEENADVCHFKNFEVVKKNFLW